MTGGVSYWKERAELAEAQRDALAAAIDKWWEDEAEDVLAADRLLDAVARIMSPDWRPKS